MTHSVISVCFNSKSLLSWQQMLLNTPSISSSLTAEIGNAISSHYIKNSEIHYSIKFVNLSVYQLLCQIVYM